MADTSNGPASPAIATPAAKPNSVAELSAAFPELCAAIRAEGAQAESARIAGIDKIGVWMKGHDALIAEMKADGRTTPEQAAMRVTAAEGAMREHQLEGIQGVENLTGKVAAAPTAQGSDGGDAPKPATPEAWAAEYAASDALKSEFATSEQYVAFKRAESEGRVKVLHRKAS